MTTCCFSNLKPQIFDKRSENILNLLSNNCEKKKNYNLIPNQINSSLNQFDFEVPNYPVSMFHWVEISAFQVLKEDNKKIVLLRVINKNQIIGSKKIFFSHDSSSNLGSILPFLIDLCSYLKCDVYSYDYSGLGESEGEFSFENLISDIISVANFMVDTLEIDIRKVILYGHSSGTLACLNLLNHRKFKLFYGIILNSILFFNQANDKGIFKFGQISSKIKIVNELLSIVSEFNRPIMLIHGKCNTTVSIETVHNISLKIKKLYSWYPNSGDHFNIMSKMRNKHHEKLNSFIQHVSMLYSRSKMGTQIYKKNILKFISKPTIIEFDKNISNKCKSFLHKKKEYVFNEFRALYPNLKKQVSKSSINVREYSIVKLYNDKEIENLETIFQALVVV